MATSGPLFPSTGVDDATVGTLTWSQPGNITADDFVEASVTLLGVDQSHYLKATGFGFAIPGGATINGILAEIKVSGTADVKQAAVLAVKGGVISGTDQSTGAALPGSSAYVSFGGSANLWGLAWTSADINAANFGVVFSSSSASTGGNPRVDAMRITITYTPAGGAGVRNPRMIL